MRLFISCFISQEISDYVKSLSDKLPEAEINVPKNIDLTIKFLGSVQGDKLAVIKEKLSKIEFDSFEAELDTIGVFPNEKFIRVVWIGVKPEEKFNVLHEKVDEALKDLFGPEKRFKAHLTIGRVKRVDDKAKFIEELKKIKIEPKKFKVDKLILFESKLSTEGAVHEKVMEIEGKPL